MFQQWHLPFNRQTRWSIDWQMFKSALRSIAPSSQWTSQQGTLDLTSVQLIQ